MIQLNATAYVKINITLDVLGKQPDGYHEMRMIMQQVDLRDELTIRTGTGQPDRVETNLRYLPADDRNLALRAARRFFEQAGVDAGGLALTIEKRIPVCAGLGGGSADAAAVLCRLQEAFPGHLSREALFALGGELGSDVPYCMLGGTALATGRGERLSVLPGLPGCWCVLCKPDFPLSTRMMFSKIDCARLRRHPDTEGVLRALEAGDLRGVTCRMYNVFEDFLEHRSREITSIRQTLMDQGALGAVMSGSGPTVFGLFSQEELAGRARDRLKEEYRDVFLVRTL